MIFERDSRIFKNCSVRVARIQYAHCYRRTTGPRWISFRHLGQTSSNGVNHIAIHLRILHVWKERCELWRDSLVTLRILNFGYDYVLDFCRDSDIWVKAVLVPLTVHFQP